ERRHLVEKELPADQARSIAESYLAEERWLEAIDFLKIAGAAERLAELRQRAISQGDAFLLRAVAGAQEKPASREDWQQLGATATEHGLERYALEARRQLERSDE